MATLIERIDDTRSHLTRESLALVSRTRRAGDGLAKAFVDEASDWQTYVITQRDAVRSEVVRLTSPRGLERAVLRLADGALTKAHGTVQARLSLLEREMSHTTRAAKGTTKKIGPSGSTAEKKARPAAKRARPTSRRLVSEPAAS